MRARRVKGIQPEGPLRANAVQIVATRLDEALAFDPAIRDPANVTELHDLRIAAKRLRYVLEVVGPVLGRDLRRLERVARELQDLLGEIHDCDVLVPLVDDHVRELREHDRAWLREGATTDADLRTRLARAPNRTTYRGLETLAGYLEARRGLLYVTFIDRWDRFLAEEWPRRVREAA
jgi:CHAD domain-containing protein